jgi:hypothetical protein
METFFNGMGRPADAAILPTPAPPDMEQLSRLASECGIELLGPPPA